MGGFILFNLQEIFFCRRAEIIYRKLNFFIGAKLDSKIKKTLKFW